jgi:hypothetical protein
VDFNRAFIERRDFPAVRRGYDPTAVERHLREVADSVEELQNLLAQPQRSTPTEPSLSSAVGEQVRMIVEAAERGAIELQSQANERVREIAERADAETETRVARAEEATDEMLRRAEALEAELGSLGDNLRVAGEAVTGLHIQAGPLRAELESVRGALDDLRGAAGAPEYDTGEMERLAEEDTQTHEAVLLDAEVVEIERVETAPTSPRGTGPSGRIDSHQVAVGEPSSSAQDELVEPEQPPEPRGAEEEIAPEATEDEDLEPSTISSAEPEPEPEPEPGEPPSRPAAPGDEGARLVALNMALNGTPREETDRYLAENFDVSDRSAVLDDVYSRVGGS